MSATDAFGALWILVALATIGRWAVVDRNQNQRRDDAPEADRR